MSKKVLYKLSSVVMAIVIAVTSSVCSFAAEKGDFEISTADGGVTLDKYLGSDENVDIPETIDGKSVVGVGISAFENNDKIKSVTVPSGVKTIASSAFSGCDSLEKITIPDSVNLIGAYAFLNCVKLDNVTLPVCSVGFGAFQGCLSLENITFPDKTEFVDRFAFEKTAWLSSQLPGTVYVADCAYTYISDSEDGDIVIKDGASSISPYAFADNSLITDVYIPDSVTSVGARAFKDCAGLESVFIPSSVTSIDSQAFGYESTGSSLTLSDRFTIYCFSGSAAEKYAQENAVKYENVDNCKHDKNKQYEITRTASCEEDGILTYTCRKCHYKETVSIEKLGHTWSEWKSVSTLGCESDGIEERTCSRCGKIEQNVTPATGHNWGEWKISKNPTCVDSGENKRECALCGKSETSEIKPTGHKWSEWVETKAAVCTTDGESQRYCTVCGANETKKIAATGSHTWGEWMQIKTPTKTAEGLAQRECSVCGKKETKSLPKKSADEPDDELILADNSSIKLDKEKRLLTGVYVGTISENLIKEFITYTHGEAVIIVDIDKTEAVTGDAYVGTGNVVMLAYDGKPQDYYYAVVLGDGDGNGKLTAADARIALRISAKMDTATDAVFAALDLNSDGKISASEARSILRASAKLETLPGMPAEETSENVTENEPTSNIR